MLTIENLYASVNGLEILQGINLAIKPGSVHAIMGPNGSGKSTLVNLLAGRPEYRVETGKVNFLGENLLLQSPEMRAINGIFLAFQYPVEIPGVNNMYFLKMALNSQRKARGEAELDAFDFMVLMKEKMKLLNMDEKFTQRAVNADFSGGEKKRNEILQMLILNPKLAILDETDSGLDIDALQTISEGINYLRSASKSILLITHYQRLLNYVKPDFVHVLSKGKIILSGDYSLALKLEEQGYAWLE